MSSSAYPPSVKVCRLYERTSARSRRYFSGYFGSASVALLLNELEVGKNGEPIWDLVISEPQPRPRPSSPPGPERRRAQPALHQALNGVGAPNRGTSK